MKKMENKIALFSVLAVFALFAVIAVPSALADIPPSMAHPANATWFDPEDSNVQDYCDTVDVDIWINTTVPSAGFYGVYSSAGYIVNLVVMDHRDTSNTTSKTIQVRNLTGCYLGAYLGCGSEDLSCESIQEFNQKMGKNHAIFARYVDIKDSENPAHWEWAEEVKRNGAMPMFIYDPWGGLDAINISDIEYLASKCKELNETVFIVFGHEMNGPWYPWGDQPRKYRQKFKEVSEIFHENAPNVEMCWVPNQNWGYPWGGTNYGDGYSEYYPEGIGAYGEYVDWVGLIFYDKDWDEDNLVPPDMFVANIRNGQNNTDFYEMFAVGKNKPMLIAETGAFDPNKDPTPPGERNPLNGTEQAEFKNEWLTQVYNVSTLKGEFPWLNAICYFHVEKRESIDTLAHSFYDIVVDYRIPEFPNLYKNLISDSYFLSSAITVANPDLVISDKWLCWPDSCTICYNVTNTGNETAPACHNTTLYVDGVEVAHDHVPVDLAPGESHTGCFNGYEWGYTPPSDNITVCADNDETLVELDETNNCLTNIWMCGDVNGDRTVNVIDVVMVYKRALDPGYPLDLPWAGDVNCDRNINVIDVVLVYKRALDPGYDLNCCCEV